MRLIITLVVFMAFSAAGYFIGKIVSPLYTHTVSFLSGVFAAIVSDGVKEYFKRKVS